MSTSPIHRGQGQHRLERERLRALKPVRAAASSGEPRRRAEPFRRSLDALLATLRRRARQGDDSEARELARRTLSVYNGARRELGFEPSPSVSAHLLAFAQQTVIAQQLGVLAAEAGLGSKRGRALVGDSQRAAGRAERAWVAANAAAGLLRGRAPDIGGARLDAPWFEPAADDDGTIDNEGGE